MKILKEGTLPPEPMHQGTCGHCGTIFEFLEYEGKVWTNPDTQAQHININCPLCKRTVTIYPPPFRTQFVRHF
jgi:hypothetical protein